MPSTSNARLGSWKDPVMSLWALIQRNVFLGLAYFEVGFIAVTRWISSWSSSILIVSCIIAAGFRPWVHKDACKGMEVPDSKSNQNASINEKGEKGRKAIPTNSHLRDTGTTYVPGVGTVKDDVLEKAKRLSKPELVIPKARKLIYVAGFGVIPHSALGDTLTASLSDAPEGSSGARLLIKTWSRSEENPASNIPYCIGSKYHPSDCTPCAYFHKKHGCNENDRCTFCHACPVGAVRTFQKEKKKAIKLLEKMRSTSTISDMVKVINERD